MTMVSSITMELRMTAPLPTLTERKRMEFSTVPSITQPSAIIEFLTFAPSLYLAGTESLTLVRMVECL